MLVSALLWVLFVFIVISPLPVLSILLGTCFSYTKKAYFVRVGAKQCTSEIRREHL